ncbi:MAG: hypothetical protein ABW091_03325, partial [Microbacterium sp.]
GEPVDVLVGEEARYHGSPRTRTQIGFAESVSIEADETAGIRLRLPDGTETEVRQPVQDGEVWLGLSKEDDGSVRVVEQPSPFGYV